MDPDQLTADIHLPRRAFALRLALRVGPGTVAVLGPSGSGKSTLLRAIAGLERPAAGRIALGGEVWFDSSRRVAVPPERRAVGLVPQDLALFPHLTAEQNVGFSSRRRAPELMRRFGIAHLADARPDALSGGERQRVALARALYGDPFLVVLDEPNASLDAAGDAALTEAIISVRRRGGIAIVIAHRPSALAAVNKVLVMANGQSRAFGPKDEVLRSILQTVPPGTAPSEAPRIEGDEQNTYQARDSA
jgi:ABC-type protease/lipase transport system fused ATPase/permease subunit